MGPHGCKDLMNGEGDSSNSDSPPVNGACTQHVKYREYNTCILNMIRNAIDSNVEPSIKNFCLNLTFWGAVGWLLSLSRVFLCIANHHISHKIVRIPQDN